MEQKIERKGATTKKKLCTKKSQLDNWFRHEDRQGMENEEGGCEEGMQLHYNPEETFFAYTQSIII